jgi:hypothetical protein
MTKHGGCESINTLAFDVQFLGAVQPEGASIAPTARCQGHVSVYPMEGIAMKTKGALMIGAVSMIIIVTSGGMVSAQGEEQNPNRRKARWDGAKMVVDTGGIALGVVTLNPAIVGLSTGRLIRNTYQLGKHTAGARRDPTTTNPTAPSPIAAPEAPVAVPGRPGYFYYPSNPNQLYFDANAVARINVRIANRAKDGRTIRYTVSGTPYEIPPGYTQALTTPAGSIISFERGDSAGAERFLLAEGSYEFRCVEQSWRFYATDGPARKIAEAAVKTTMGPNSPVAR